MTGHTARHLFHWRTPWLFIWRDHPLRPDTRKPPKKDRESYDDQLDRLSEILMLPDDADEPRELS